MSTVLKALERRARRLIPVSLRVAPRVFANLEFRYGHLKTVRLGRPVERNGDPLPWYTYPTIEYLQQLDFSDADVFEYGSGNSTLFWNSVAKTVTAVEDDEAWHRRISKQLGDGVEYRFVPRKDDYIQAVAAGDRRFDCIVVDGSHRQDCATAAVAFLRPGGLMILDNSDWYPNTAAYLRERGLIQIDMHGFGPVNPYTWTTSLFLDRAFAMKPKGDRQPGYSKCAKRVVHDRPARGAPA